MANQNYKMSIAKCSILFLFYFFVSTIPLMKRTKLFNFFCLNDFLDD